ncbi:MAG: carboxypeptidase-like regulatory domain-containing protein, partial [Pseudomonadota bacterium]|nr:carboxypeptidase-like regulatory domain-containing protein [Pseudomonadota bacterium]
MSDVFKRIVGVLSVVLLVSCGGGGGGSSGDSGDGGQQNDPGNDTGSYTPEEKNVERLVFLDANNQPLAGAEVKLLAEADLPSEGAAVAKAAASSAVYFPDIDSFPDFTVTGVFLDENGALDITGLAPGLYFVEVSTNGVIAYQVINIVDGSAVVLFSVVIPVSCDLDICEGVDAIVGSLSGQVYAEDGPIEGAQVSLGTSATNGAYATAQTDAEGNYSLNFNVSAEFADELTTSTLRASAPGYATVSRTISVASGAASGANIELVELTQSEEVIWRETFESDSLTRDAWAISGGAGETRWRYLMAGHGVVNTLQGSHVQAAPGDQTAGKLPPPLQGQVSYWYGDTMNGNFIGEQDLESSVPFDGGLSVIDNAGMLESPSVDLSQVSAPIRLGFKTWWEIESVNPNENGFDLMVIQV